jgi:L-seryl-tRNA(Ser) seleniumtransferase
MADFRVIPSIEQLRQRAEVRSLEEKYGRDAIVGALREAAAALRDALGRGDAAPADEQAAVDRIARDAEARLARGFQPSLRRVINASGVVIHTNLGRAPLAAPALARLAQLGAGYTNLEYDLARGGR